MGLGADLGAEFPFVEAQLSFVDVCPQVMRARVRHERKQHLRKLIGGEGNGG